MKTVSTDALGQKTYRLIVLIRGRHADEENFKWIPLDALDDFRYKMLFPDLTGNKPENSLETLRGLQQRLFNKYGPGMHPNIRFNRFTAGEYNRLEKSNLLIIQLSSLDEGKSNKIQDLSNTLGCLTLGVFPIGGPAKITSVVTVVDHQGKHHDVRSLPAPVIYEELSWLFILWGPLVSDDYEELLDLTIEQRIQEALRRIEIGFPSSNITAQN